MKSVLIGAALVAYAVSDEALEATAGSGKEQAGNFTLGACTGLSAPLLDLVPECPTDEASDEIGGFVLFPLISFNFAPRSLKFAFRHGTKGSFGVSIGARLG